MGKALPRIERGTTKIIVPYGKEEIAFDAFSEGPDDYQNVGKGFLARNLGVPVGDYSAFLVHAAYCIPEVENEPEFKEIREVIRCRKYWVFNRNLWTSSGVYVVLDSDAVGRTLQLDQNELEKMLKDGIELSCGIRFSKDKKIRFAPKESYKLGEHTPESLAKDGFVIASYGLLGAEKLGEVASSKFNYNPKIAGVKIKKRQDPEQRVSVLRSRLCDLGYGLCIFGDNFGRDRIGHAFGVLKG